jgi:hypothetical protein
MKYVASVLVLVGALAGVAHAENAASKAGALPKVSVTIEEIQTVVVETKQWSRAEEEALRKAQEPAHRPTFAQLAGKITQGLKYAMQ